MDVICDPHYNFPHDLGKWCAWLFHKYEFENVDFSDVYQPKEVEI